MNPAVIFSGLLLIAQVSCSEKQLQEQSETVSITSTDSITCTIPVSISWGDRQQDISPTILDAPFFGTVIEEQKRKTYAGVVVRTDSRGGMHVMKQYINYEIVNEPGAFVMHFSATGDFSGKTIIPALDKKITSRMILDYTADSANNTYILSIVAMASGEERYNYLVKIDSMGAVVWEKKGIYSDTALNFQELKGTFTTVYANASGDLYLSAGVTMHSIAVLNAKDGSLVKTCAMQPGNNKVICFNDSGIVARSIASPTTWKHTFSLYEISSGEEPTREDDMQATYAMKGIDNNRNCYTYLWNEGVKKIAPAGNVLFQFPFRYAVVRNDNESIYFSYQDVGILHVSCYPKSGSASHWTAKVPYEDTVTKRFPVCRLVHVDAENHLHFLVGEAPFNAGTIVVMSDKGDIIREQKHPFDLFAIESNFHFLNVATDTQGNIYLPVTDPEGVKIVRMRISE